MSNMRDDELNGGTDEPRVTRLDPIADDSAEAERPGPSKGLGDRLITYAEATDDERAQMDAWRASLDWKDTTTLVRFGIDEMDALAQTSKSIIDFFLENDPRKHETTLQGVAEGIQARMQALADEGLFSSAGRDVVVDGAKGAARGAGALVAWTGNAIAGATNAVLNGWSRKKKQRTQVDINLQASSIKKAVDEVTSLSDQLKGTQDNLVSGFSQLQTMRNDNLDMYEKTELLIAAAGETLREWRDDKMPALMARAEDSGRESDSRNVSRMDRAIVTLDRRINDMLALRFECAKQVVVLDAIEKNYGEWLTQVADQRATGQVRAIMQIAMSALMKVSNDAKLAVADQQEFNRQLNEQFHEALRETTESMVEARAKGVLNYAEQQDSARKIVQVLTYQQTEDRKYVAQLAQQRTELVKLGSNLRAAHDTLLLTAAPAEAAETPALPASKPSASRAGVRQTPREDIIDAEIEEVRGPAKPRRMAPRP